MTQSEHAPHPPVTDAGPVALLLLGFTLFMIGVGFAIDQTAAVGVDYAILVSAIAQLVAGVLCLIKGLHFPGYVMTTFGCFLTGLFCLLTIGVANAESTGKMFTGHAVGWYSLAIVFPLAILNVPVFKHRDVPFMIAFPILTLLNLTLGLSELTGPRTELLQLTGWLALAAAPVIWFKAARDIYAITAPPAVTAEPVTARAPQPALAVNGSGRRNELHEVRVPQLAHQ